MLGGIRAHRQGRSAWSQAPSVPQALPLRAKGPWANSLPLSNVQSLFNQDRNYNTSVHKVGVRVEQDEESKCPGLLVLAHKIQARGGDLEKAEDWGPHGCQFSCSHMRISGQEHHRQSWAPQLAVRSLLICCLPWPHCGRAVPAHKWQG